MKQRTLSVYQKQHTNNKKHKTNLATTNESKHETTQRGAELVVLQELHTGRYFCQHDVLGFFD